MKQLFHHDTIPTGLTIGLGSEILTALLLWIALRIADEPASIHVAWFGICFIPPILLLRHYAKGKRHPRITKTLAVVLFITFIVFLWLLTNRPGQAEGLLH